MRREMNARYILPMHHSTFRLSREPIKEPIRRLYKAAGDESWRICLSHPGETWRLPDERSAGSSEPLRHAERATTYSQVSDDFGQSLSS